LGLQLKTAFAMAEHEKHHFSALDQADIPRVAYSLGETIIAEDAPAEEMYLVRKGRVSIEVNGKTIEEIGEGAIFGEMALIANSARTAAFVAIDNCEVIPVDQRLFLILIQETPRFALEVMRALTERLRHMDQYV
jgi:CRP-like cAMP-binding protein